jgi:hypothetical protein
MLKAIHAQEDRRAAQSKAAEVVSRLKEMRLRTAAELVEQKGHETLTYYAFPSTHWRQIKTNNPLDWIIREVRRRTRVVGAFPDGHSALMLAAARLRHRIDQVGKATLHDHGPAAQSGQAGGGSGLKHRASARHTPVRLHCGFAVDDENQIRPPPQKSTRFVTPPEAETQKRRCVFAQKYSPETGGADPARSCRPVA